MKALSVLVVAALAGSGYFAKDLATYTDAPQDTSGLEAHETNAGASVLGQFRTSATGWLWLRTDLYLHNGVEMRQLSEQEKRAGHKGVGSSDEELGEILGDNMAVTLIPSKDRDFRGIFGDIERETQSYAGMENHAHNAPSDALPLFRLMTWIDPQFAPGWTTAATIMAGEHSAGALDRAIALLQEGLRANPNNVGLLNEIGRFYAAKKGDFASAIPYLQRAVAQELDITRMDEDTAESYINAHRWLALCFRETNQPDKQRATAALGLTRFPGDVVLVRAIGEPPYVLSEIGQQEWLESAIKENSKEEEEHVHSDSCGHAH